LAAILVVGRARPGPKLLGGKALRFLRTLEVGERRNGATIGPRLGRAGGQAPPRPGGGPPRREKVVGPSLEMGGGELAGQKRYADRETWRSMRAPEHCCPPPVPALRF